MSSITIIEEFYRTQSVVNSAIYGALKHIDDYQYDHKFDINPDAVKYVKQELKKFKRPN